MLLSIDPARLIEQVVTEPVPGTDDQFPHLYGELPVVAVRRVTPYDRGSDGRFGSAPIDNR